MSALSPSPGVFDRSVSPGDSPQVLEPLSKCFLAIGVETLEVKEDKMMWKRKCKHHLPRIMPHHNRKKYKPYTYPFIWSIKLWFVRQRKDDLWKLLYKELPWRTNQGIKRWSPFVIKKRLINSISSTRYSGFSEDAPFTPAMVRHTPPPLAAIPPAAVEMDTASWHSAIVQHPLTHRNWPSHFSELAPIKLWPNFTSILLSHQTLACALPQPRQWTLIPPLGCSDWSTAAGPGSTSILPRLGADQGSLSLPFTGRTEL